MTRACACCHTICEVELRTCPLCGEATWLEIEESVEALRAYAEVVVQEVVSNKPPKPKRQQPKPGTSAARQAIIEMRASRKS